MKNLTIITAIIALALTGCQKVENIQPSGNVASKSKMVKKDNSQTPQTSNFGEGGRDYCGIIKEVKLLAGQSIEVGTVSVANDEYNLYVTYNLTAGDWQFGTLHLYVGSLSGTPVTKTGSPIPGHFPYTADVNGSTTSYTFTIPTSSLPDCYIVAAHAEVNGRGRETAWGAGTRFLNKGNWATYFNDCRDICGGEPGLKNKTENRD